MTAARSRLEPLEALPAAAPARALNDPGQLAG
jgi:hypothetical protein